MATKIKLQSTKYTADELANIAINGIKKEKVPTKDGIKEQAVNADDAEALKFVLDIMQNRFALLLNYDSKILNIDNLKYDHKKLSKFLTLYLGLED